ncbi:MAG: hypothetical protein ACKVJ6_03480 [Flavobacteriales bacterium]
MRSQMSQRRKQKIDSGNTSGFLLFAMVEVLLIILGITAAIQFDNMNELSKTENDIEAVLTEIKLDLSNDIKNSELIYLNYLRTNKITDVIYNPETSKEEISNMTVLLDNELRFYKNFPIRTDGYEAIKKLFSEAPEKYKNSIKDINTFYKRKITLDIYNERCRNTIYEYQDYLINNQPWFNLDSHNEVVSSDQIDYYFHNPKVKAQMGLVADDVAELYIQTLQYRTAAIDLYSSIHNSLGDTSSIPDHITYKNSNIELMTSYEGSYKWIKGASGKIDFKGEGVSIVFKDDFLYLILPNGKELRLLSLNDSCFYISKSYDLVTIDKSGKLEYIQSGIKKDCLFEKTNP